MATTIALTPECPDMESDPSINAGQWNEFMDHQASILCVDIFGIDGLYSQGLTMSTARWTTHSANAPRPVFKKPVLRADGSNQIVYKDKYKKYKAILEACKTLDALALATVGRSIQRELYVPGTGHRGTTCQHIVQHVWDTYGKRSKDDIKTLNNRLDATFSASISFGSQATTLSQTFYELEQAGQPKSEYDKLDYLEKATAHIAGVVHCLQLYEESEMDEAKRTFKNAVSFIRARVKRLTPTAAGFVGTAAATTPSGEPVFSTPEQAETYRMGLTARANAAHAAEGSSATTKKTSKQPKGPYCFVHAYRGHSGAECSKMRTANETTPGKYSPAQIAATSPGTIDGVKGRF